MKTNIRGVGVALVTPFNKKAEVDYDALGRLMDHVAEGGVDYLVALGTTAETPTLTCDEKSDIVAYIRERNGGRLPLIVGVGGNSTKDVIAAIDKTDLTGVCGVLSVTPYYNKPSQEGLFQHYKAVAAESPVPLLLYNVPGRTGVNMCAGTTLRIANEVDNVLGVKEASGNVAQITEILMHRPENFKVISGDDMLALPIAAIGGDGVISVAGNAFPALFCRMMECAEKGDYKAASQIHLRVSDAIQALFAEGNPVGVKGALAIKGVVENYLRLPLVPCSKELYASLEKLIGRDVL